MAVFNEIKNKYCRNIRHSNAGEQVVQIDGIGRRPSANYPRRLMRLRRTLRARVTARVHVSAGARASPSLDRFHREVQALANVPEEQ